MLPPEWFFDRPFFEAIPTLRGSNLDQRSVSLIFEPAGDCCSDVILFVFSQKVALGNAVPFGETGSAAGRGSMLSDEDGVTAHWCLFAVTHWFCWRKPLGNEIGGVLQNDGQSAHLKIGQLCLPEPKS
jgi:hypothetical protein